MNAKFQQLDVCIEKVKVKIFHWIENQVDRIRPKVEVTNRSNKMFKKMTLQVL